MKHVALLILWALFGASIHARAQPLGGLQRLLPGTAALPRFERAGGQVHAIAVMPDGRVYVAGDFTWIASQPRVGVARLLANGALDETFAPQFFTGTPFALALQPDGKLLVGGNFDSVGGNIRNALVRLNEDGSLDDTFHIGAGFGTSLCLGSNVAAVLVQPDGGIVVVGCMTDYDIAPVHSIARLHPNGELDEAFAVGSGFDGIAASVALQADGRIVVGGSFTSFNGLPAPYIGRLNADGSRDTTFNPGAGFNRSVSQVALQPDGAMVVGGLFDLYNHTACDGLVRLLPNGDRDPTFTPPAGFSTASAIHVLADGDILLGGAFYSFNGSVPGRIARLNSDGTLDAGFQPGTGFNDRVSALGVLPDQSIVVGGTFTQYLGEVRVGLAWLATNAALRPRTCAMRRSGYVTSVSPRPGGGWAVGGSFDFVDGSLRPGVCQLLDDGSLDPDYVPVSTLDAVARVAVDGSGRLLATGWNAVVGDVPIHRVRRFTVTGAIDSEFSPPDFNDQVRAILPTPDGKVVVSGRFTTVGLSDRNRLARLNADGSLDLTFDPPTGADDVLDALALQPDGKILTGGRFVWPEDGLRFATIRINPDGTFDPSYQAGGAGQVVSAIVVQPDGRIITAATGFTPNLQTYGLILRFNADGSLDPTFDDGNSFNIYDGFNGPVSSLALQPDGKLWVGGDFYYYRGYNTYGLARLNSDGSLDASLTWNAKASSIDSGGRAAFSLATNARGDVLAGGTWMLSPSFAGGGTLTFRATTLANLSARTIAGRNENTLIAGLATAGSGAQTLLFRAIGPTLAELGVSDVLADPQLRLYTQGAMVPTTGNDDWGGTVELQEVFAQVGAFNLPPASLDAALTHVLPAGTITAHVTSAVGTGVALVEIYDTGLSNLNQQLVNLSARSFVGTNDDILILGFVIRGSSTRRLLIRGIGPTLAELDVTNALVNPMLEVYRQNEAMPLAQNDNWSYSPELVAMFERTHAFPLPLNAADAALVIVLPPGIYTAHVRGVAGASGVALAEVYVVD